MSSLRIDAPAVIRFDSPGDDCACTPKWEPTDLGPRAVPCGCSGAATALATEGTNTDGRNIVADARAEMLARNVARSTKPIGATAAPGRAPSVAHDHAESVVEKARREMHERNAKRFAVK